MANTTKDDMEDDERKFLLRAFCSQRLSNIKQHLDRINGQFENFNNELNVRESYSVKRLIIVASIFLPLSLASSVLSMQTRFVDLHLLLYDILGVFCLISSFTLVVYSQ